MPDNNILINGRQILFDAGETILEAASRYDISIPTLCHLKENAPNGKCRICVVEIEGEKELKTACNTPCGADMVIKTESRMVVADRKKTLVALVASGNHNCAAATAWNSHRTNFQIAVQNYDHTGNLCPSWGDCRLQDLLYYYYVRQKEPFDMKQYLQKEIVNPLIERDFSKCILCGRCVSVCNEVQINSVIVFCVQDGMAKNVTRNNTYLAYSNCVFCGACIQACPVGALSEKESSVQVAAMRSN
ncbi:Molybdopterin oxidoreductase Fe4S4 region (fragment) [uncultured Desulfobacterium sp.]|uniref:Molybdopterin oxidoreductase Fe4S4 region n=1 Tax=uncultured Desulfobacterium sp. TaxID=201089 RepID=A0A445N1D8_9BACT